MNTTSQPQEELPFPRDNFIAEVTSYYSFLSKIYLPSSVIKIPPPTGWPEITPSYLACLHKNDTVIDLIRHLPMIQRDEYDDPYQIYDLTSSVDFTGDLIRNGFAGEHPQVDLAEPMQEMLFPLPAHVLCWATTTGGRNGFYVFVDTTRDAVILADLQTGPQPTYLSRIGENKQDEWMEYATYTAKDFFEMWKKEFRDFRIIATSEKDYEYCDDISKEPWPRKLKEIYEAHGIFTESYDREACLAEIRRVELEHQETQATSSA